MVANVNSLEGHADPESKQAGCGDPATALTNLSSLQSCHRGVRMWNGPERIVRLSPVDDRLFDEKASHANRLWVSRRKVGDVIGRVNVLPAMMVRSSEADAR